MVAVVSLQLTTDVKAIASLYILANPKSAIFTWPAPEIKIFWGFKSLWTIRWECKKSTPFNSWCVKSCHEICEKGLCQLTTLIVTNNLSFHWNSINPKYNVQCIDLQSFLVKGVSFSTRYSYIHNKVYFWRCSKSFFKGILQSLASRFPLFSCVWSFESFFKGIL